MPPGRLITVEGVDGSGKTTLAAGLGNVLRARGLDVRVLREPGGVDVAERIRELVHDPALGIAPRAEALLFAAARAQLVEEALEPLLQAGVWVILDRFVDSSLAYQGGGRGLGIDEVAEINRFATQSLGPDRTLLLVLAPELGRSRARARETAIDRLEREHDDFFSRVAATYSRLAAADPERFRTLDAMAAAKRDRRCRTRDRENVSPCGASGAPR